MQRRLSLHGSSGTYSQSLSQHLSPQMTCCFSIPPPQGHSPCPALNSPVPNYTPGWTAKFLSQECKVITLAREFLTKHFNLNKLGSKDGCLLTQGTKNSISKSSITTYHLLVYLFELVLLLHWLWSAEINKHAYKS